MHNAVQIAVTLTMWTTVALFGTLCTYRFSLSKFSAAPLRSANRSKYLAILTLLVFSGAASYGGTKTGADFLKIPLGARSLSLGQADTAVTDQVDALSRNPGALWSPALNKKSLISLTHESILDNNSLDYIGAVVPAGALTFGLDVARLSYAEQDQRDSNRIKTGSFQPSDLAAGAGVSLRSMGMQFGAHMKLLRQQLAGDSAQGYAFDLGLVSRSANSRHSFGASVLNIGSSMKFVSDSYQLPLTLSVGTAYQVSRPLLLSLDVRSRPHQNQFSLAAGGEFTPRQNVTLRAGYLAKLAEAITNNDHSKLTSENSASLGGVTGGLGLRMGAFSLDYAVSPFGELGNTQTITISSSFGPATKTNLIVKAPAASETSSLTALADDRIILVLPRVNSDESWWMTLK